MQALRGADYLLIGWWTSGLMIVRQHPDRPWVDFARAIPSITGPRVGLFTTYKLATGSMFAQMRRHLAGRVPAPLLELKSRSRRLSEANRQALDRYLNGT